MKDISKQDSWVLKGIAILMMLCHHNFREAGLYAGYSVSFWPFYEYQIIKLSDMFKICVCIFVFISGYGLTLSYKSINKDYKLKREEIVPWLVQRLIKVLSGYWFVFLLSSVICQLIDGRTWNVYFADGFLFGIYQFVVSFLGISRILELPLLNFTWWYMSAVIIYIFFVPIFNYVAKNYIGYGASLFLFWLMPHFLRISYPGSTQALPFTLIMFIGCACAEYKVFGKLKMFIERHSGGLKTLVWLIIAFVAFFVCYKEYSVFTKEGLWEVPLAIIPLIIIFLCYVCICPIPYLNKALAFLGKHSMNIFLTHTFVRWIYLKDFTYSWGHFMVINIVLLVISLAMSFVIEWMKKIIGYQKIINKITEKCVNAFCRGEADNE